MPSTHAFDEWRQTTFDPTNENRHGNRSTCGRSVLENPIQRTDARAFINTRAGAVVATTLPAVWWYRCRKKSILHGCGIRCVNGAMQPDGGELTVARISLLQNLIQNSNNSSDLLHNGWWTAKREAESVNCSSFARVVELSFAFHYLGQCRTLNFDGVRARCAWQFARMSQRAIKRGKQCSTLLANRLLFVAMQFRNTDALQICKWNC